MARRDPDESADDQPQHRLDRTVFAHTELFSIADSSLRGGRDNTGRGDYIVAIVMAAFAFEAYLNFVGDKLLPFWGDIDSIRVAEKLSVICAHVGHPPDFGRRPYQSLHELWKIRNALAHTRTESFSVVRDGLPVEPIKYPESYWETKCTFDVATKLLRDVREVCDDLHERTRMTGGAVGEVEERGGEILR